MVFAPTLGSKLQIDLKPNDYKIIKLGVRTMDLITERTYLAFFGKTIFGCHSVQTVLVKQTLNSSKIIQQQCNYLSIFRMLVLDIFILLSMPDVYTPWRD